MAQKLLATLTAATLLMGSSVMPALADGNALTNAAKDVVGKVVDGLRKPAGGTPDDPGASAGDYGPAGGTPDDPGASAGDDEPAGGTPDDPGASAGDDEPAGGTPDDPGASAGDYEPASGTPDDPGASAGDFEPTSDRRHTSDNGEGFDGQPKYGPDSDLPKQGGGGSGDN